MPNKKDNSSWQRWIQPTRVLILWNCLRTPPTDISAPAYRMHGTYSTIYNRYHTHWLSSGSWWWLCISIEVIGLKRNCNWPIKWRKLNRDNWLCRYHDCTRQQFCLFSSRLIWRIKNETSFGAAWNGKTNGTAIQFYLNASGLIIHALYLQGNIINIKMKIFLCMAS